MAVELNSDKFAELYELNLGDKVLLTNGEEAEFVRLKQKKFIGIMRGTSYDIPVNMYVKTIERKEKKDKTKEIQNMKNGQKFMINHSGLAVIYIFDGIKNGWIIGINPITRGRAKIAMGLFHSTI